MPSTCWPTYARTRLLRDRRDRVEARLAELALDVVLRREPVAAVGVEAGVRRAATRPPRRAASPCSPRRRTAGPRRRARPPCSAQVRGLDRRVRPRDRELHALVRADRPAEDDALGGVARRPSRRTSARRRCTPPRSGSARRSCRRGCSGSPCPPRRSARPREASRPSKKTSVVAWFIIVPIGRIVEPLCPRSRMSTRKTREALGALLDLVERRRAREQHHQVGVQRARGPDLLAVDRRSRRRRARPWSVICVVSEPAVGLGDAEGLQPQLARRDPRQVLLPSARRCRGGAACPSCTSARGRRRRCRR